MPRETEESPQNAEEPGLPGDPGDADGRGAARAPAGREDVERTISGSGPAAGGDTAVPEEGAAVPGPADAEGSAQGAGDTEEGGESAPMSVDPSALKALAHPLRVRMYDLLSDHGAATASQLAERVGESSGTTSYHLRLLAKHGFIEEEPGRGNRRDRYWRARSYNLEADKMEDDPEAMAHLRIAAGELWRGHARQIETWYRSAEAWGPAWRSASASSRATFYATHEELAELRDELLRTAEQLIKPLSGRQPPEGQPPEGSVRTALQIHLFPLSTPEENPPEGS